MQAPRSSIDRTETFEEALRLQPGKTALVVVDMQRGVLTTRQIAVEIGRW